MALILADINGQPVSVGDFRASATRRLRDTDKHRLLSGHQAVIPIAKLGRPLTISERESISRRDF